MQYETIDLGGGPRLLTCGHAPGCEYLTALHGPAGYIFEHGPGRQCVAILWVCEACYPGAKKRRLAPILTLDEIKPVSLAEVIVCGECGLSGRIRRARWEEADV